MSYREYREEPVVRETTPVVHEESNGVVGFAAIKYTAIVVIVLAILAFLALYVIPHITG
jgi:hypothetical protein